MTYKWRLNGDDPWWSSRGSVGADKAGSPLRSASPASVCGYQHQAVKSTHRSYRASSLPSAEQAAQCRRSVRRAEAAETALARTFWSAWQAACSKSASRGIITGMRCIFHYWNAPVVNLISETERNIYALLNVAFLERPTCCYINDLLDCVIPNYNNNKQVDV